jgi:isochorismate synthase
MALAGTMPFAENIGWSDKNIQEQRYVATYITEKLEHFSSDISEQGPRTVRAGHLAHLRSDFLFTLNDVNRLGSLIEALHPTPAVCGLPKEEAFRFILDNEHNDRRYYSGFMGPLHLMSETRLFVTLRCMQIFRDGYRLYAGGGLLRDSQEEQEWQETEAKLETMRRLLNSQIVK